MWVCDPRLGPPYYLHRLCSYSKSTCLVYVIEQGGQQRPLLSVAALLQFSTKPDKG